MAARMEYGDANARFICVNRIRSIWTGENLPGVSGRSCRMFYLGHFLFETGPDEESSFGYFTCLAEGADTEEALGKFEKQVLNLADTSDLFNGVRYIYLSDVVEFSSLPENGIMARFEVFPGELPPSENITMPGQEETDACSFYRPIAEGADEDSDEDILVPFLEFED